MKRQRAALRGANGANECMVTIRGTWPGNAHALRRALQCRRHDYTVYVRVRRRVGTGATGSALMLHIRGYVRALLPAGPR